MKIKTRRYYIYYLMRIGAFIAGLLPFKAASAVGRFFGGIGFIILDKERLKTIGHLTQAFPEKSYDEIRTLARNVFRNISANFAEYSQIRRITAENVDNFISEKGLEKLRQAMSHGKGCVLLTAHFGNWELVGAYMLFKGFTGSTIVRKVYFDKYDTFLKGLRQTYNMPVIDRNDSPKKMLRVLKNNQVLGMLADQDIDSIDGVFVDFFGKKAYTPVAPVRLAIASGAPIVPCYVLRDGGKYTCFVDDPIFIDREAHGKEEIVKEYTQKWTSVLEKYIRLFPDQWVWMHRRWKTQENI